MRLIRTDVPVAKGGSICYAAGVNDSKLSKPLGRTLRRKEIVSFVFVLHEYPRQAARGIHSHPWLHLTIVCRGLYSRKQGRQSFDYKTGSLTFLQTNESHTDCYVAGSKCLHVVIPSNVEKALTSAFGTQGIVRGISPDLSACASIALQREFRLSRNGHSPTWQQKWVCTRSISAGPFLSISVARLANTSGDSACCEVGSCLR